MTAHRCQVCSAPTDLTVRGLPGHPPFVDVCPGACLEQLTGSATHTSDLTEGIECAEYSRHQFRHTWSVDRWTCPPCQENRS